MKIGIDLCTGCVVYVFVDAGGGAAHGGDADGAEGIFWGYSAFSDLNTVGLGGGGIILELLLNAIPQL